MSYKLEQQVASLVHATTELTREVANQKTRLMQAVDDALGHSETASDHADRAGIVANNVLATPATKDKLGSIKAGSGLHLEDDGTLHAIEFIPWELERKGGNSENGSFLDQGYILWDGFGSQSDTVGYSGAWYDSNKKSFYVQDNSNNHLTNLACEIDPFDWGIFYTNGGVVQMDVKAPLELTHQGVDFDYGNLYMNLPIELGVIGQTVSSVRIEVYNYQGQYRVSVTGQETIDYTTDINIDDQDYALGLSFERESGQLDGEVTFILERVSIIDGMRIPIYQQKLMVNHRWFGDKSGLGWTSGSYSKTGCALQILKQELQYIAPSAAASDSDRVVLVKPKDDLKEVIRSGVRTIRLMAGGKYTWDNIKLPSGFSIEGNGATITTSGLNKCLILDKLYRKDGGCKINNVIFEGQPNSPLNTSIVKEHVAITMWKSYRNKITNCTFKYWRGAGITVRASATTDEDLGPGDTVFSQGNYITDNVFTECWCGVSATDRAEYSAIQGNLFNSCRVGVINTSGNWSVNNNMFSTVMCGYFSINKPTPWGVRTDDNWCHGTFVGNKANHANQGGGVRWESNGEIPCGVNGTDVYNPNGYSVFTIGVLPPTISGLTSYYSDVKIENHGFDLFTLSSCVFSTCTVSTDAPNSGKLKLVGCSSHTSLQLININRNTDCFPPIP